MDPDRFPPSMKRYPGGLPRTPLPRELPVRVSAADALAGRVPARDLTTRSPSASWLRCSTAAGVVRTIERNGTQLPFRAAGSAGGRFPPRVYVSAHGLDGVTDGVHWYDRSTTPRPGRPAAQGEATTVIVTGALADRLEVCRARLPAYLLGRRDDVPRRSRSPPRSACSTASSPASPTPRWLSSSGPTASTSSRSLPSSRVRHPGRQPDRICGRRGRSTTPRRSFPGHRHATGRQPGQWVAAPWSVGDALRRRRTAGPWSTSSSSAAPPGSCAGTPRCPRSAGFAMAAATAASRTPSSWRCTASTAWPRALPLARPRLPGAGRRPTRRGRADLCLDQALGGDAAYVVLLRGRQRARRPRLP